MLDAFRAWLDAASVRALPKIPVGVAAGYCIGQWSKLTAFLEDGRLEIGPRACALTLTEKRAYCPPPIEGIAQS